MDTSPGPGIQPPGSAATGEGMNAALNQEALSPEPAPWHFAVGRGVQPGQRAALTAQLCWL